MDENAGKVQCEICKKWYRDGPKLARHVKELHGTGSKERFYCPIEGCEKNFSRKEAISLHIKGYHEHHPDYWCEKCGMASLSKNNLQEHIRFVHLNIFPFECNQCDKKFKRKSFLNVHIQKKHGSYFGCKECGKLFINKGQMDKHNLHMHNIQPKLFKSYRKPVTKEESPTTEDGQEDKLKNTCICPICGKSLRKNHFNTHMANVHPGPDYTEVQCVHCGKWCFSEDSLATHIIREHEEKKFLCNHCEQRFALKEELTNHMHSAHAVPKPSPVKPAAKGVFECKSCGKRTATKATMLNHIMRSHLEDRKPLNCKWCPQKCYFADPMIEHIVRLHKEHFGKAIEDEIKTKAKEERKRREPLCTPFYIVRSDITLEKLKCDECDKEVVGDDPKGMLKRHKKAMHAKESDRVPCNHCSRTFISKRSLRQHMVFKHTHLVEKIDRRIAFPNEDGEFECEHCPRIFTKRRSIVRHLHLKHGVYKNRPSDGPVKNTTKEIQRSNAIRIPLQTSPIKNEPKDTEEVEEDPNDPDFYPELTEADSPKDTFAVDTNDNDDSGDDFTWDLPDHDMDNNVKDEPVEVKVTATLKKKTKAEFVCWTCGKDFSKVDCTNRKINMDREIVVQCLDCDGCFGVSGLLKTHVESVRLFRDFICADCGMIFNKRRHLNNHLKSAHNDNVKREAHQILDPSTTVVWNKGILK